MFRNFVWTTKNFLDGTSWHSLPPLLSINSCDTGSFLKHRRFPLRSFSVLWDNRVSMGSCDTRPFFLSLKFFDTRNFLNHRRVPPRNFSVPSDKFLTENCDTPSLPLLFIKFCDTWIFLTHRRFYLRSFCVLRNKKVSTKILILFCIKCRNQWWNWCLSKNLKTKFRTVVPFLTVCKSWSKHFFWRRICQC